MKTIKFDEDKNYKLHSKKYFVEITETNLELKEKEEVEVVYKNIASMKFIVSSVEETTFDKIPSYVYAIVTGEKLNHKSKDKCYVYLFQRKEIQ